MMQGFIFELKIATYAEKCLSACVLRTDLFKRSTSRHSLKKVTIEVCFHLLAVCLLN